MSNASQSAKPAKHDDLPLCVQAMGCYCTGHARGDDVFAPCDTNEYATAEHSTTEPTTEQVYHALEQAIQEVCDQDTQNDTGKELARILREVADRYEHADGCHDGEYPCYLSVPARDSKGYPAGDYRLKDEE